MAINEGDIYVDYVKVNNVEDALTGADGAVQAILDEIQQACTDLTNNWLGSSVDAYGQIQGKWNQDIADMKMTLASANRTLEEVKINYGNTDNTLALQWGAI